MIDEALKQLNIWQTQGLDLEISINISSQHLLESTFIDDIKAVIQKYPDVNTEFFQLEILESSAIDDIKAISQIINILYNDFSIICALDDFGTGYSSLSYIRSLPVHVIKIDHSFVRDMLSDSDDYSIVESVVMITKAFNRIVIAEGVESLSHGLELLSLGCQTAQGYAIGKPMPADELPDRLSHYIPNQDWIDYGHDCNDSENLTN